jgi:FkbM family methyltransferase
MFVSYAQNFEDVVLWRLFRDLPTGVYVDVGAAGPVVDSVTKAFYDAGWSGLNVEPADHYADLLEEARPRDTVARLCAGAEAGEAVFHLVEGTGLSTMSDDGMALLGDAGYRATEVVKPMERLDKVMSDAGLSGREINFLKVDVEGLEEAALRGIDFTVWRPWVVVVEATMPNSTEPSHQGWEPYLLASGYSYCLFDGLNRFYLADEHAEYRSRLSYPACVFDQPFVTAAYDDLHGHYLSAMETIRLLKAAGDTKDSSHEDLKRAHDEVSEVSNRLQREQEELRLRSSHSEQEIQLMKQTVSWRLTAPLRRARSWWAHGNR